MKITSIENGKRVTRSLNEAIKHTTMSDKELKELTGGFIGMHCPDAENILINKCGAVFADERIDDGGDIPGTYVMQRSFRVGRSHIDLYYLNTDGIISYVRVLG